MGIKTLGIKTALIGATMLWMAAAGGARGSEPASPDWVTAEVPQADFAAAISAGAHAPDSLTVQFYAKVYLLPSADSPLLGVTGDGGRVPLYRIKGAWSQIGFRNSTGWIQVGRQKARGKLSGLGLAAARRLPAGVSLPVACTAAAGGLMLTILSGILWLASRRRRKSRESPPGRASESLPSAETRPPCALEGRILVHGMAEILQFLELGRRSGMLSVEDGHPAGVINFQEGLITFAHTRACEGMEAVMEILAMEDGAFHFFADKQVRQANCRLSALEVLLHHAQRMDEIRNQVYQTGT